MSLISSFDLNKPVAIGSDHAGFVCKQQIIAHLEKLGLKVKDFGTHSTDSVDYPDFAHPTAACVENGEAGFGILICGSANGVAITANKHAGIRAGICWNLEVVELLRLHNDANILCLPARFVEEEQALDMTDLFIKTSFEGGRHAKRVNKMACS
jgi:ribose 5-phosphate isomerase B